VVPPRQFGGGTEITIGCWRWDADMCTARCISLWPSLWIKPAREPSRCRLSLSCRRAGRTSGACWSFVKASRTVDPWRAAGWG